MYIFTHLTLLISLNLGHFICYVYRNLVLPICLVFIVWVKRYGIHKATVGGPWEFPTFLAQRERRRRMISSFMLETHLKIIHWHVKSTVKYVLIIICYSHTNLTWAWDMKCMMWFENIPAFQSSLPSCTVLILGLRPANERRRTFVTTSLIAWAQT